eukprot:CAMPEP_0198110392 /NCGR_PEP_ID=MMETSP1442-20131203/2416_1 /TAXON_ID= /ORGANISM="Craspedostauros australis, Strain CCMP3328" /LENGTH=145 /DNA_ID=CAMNT_0043766433 /DNA_START=89 /DNA_END=526 /DNA_ORIENTATION=-
MVTFTDEEKRRIQALWDLAVSCEAVGWSLDLLKDFLAQVIQNLETLFTQEEKKRLLTCFKKSAKKVKRNPRNWGREVIIVRRDFSVLMILVKHHNNPFRALRNALRNAPSQDQQQVLRQVGSGLNNVQERQGKEQGEVERSEVSL